MKGIALILISILTSCYGFLLNNNVSSAFITDDEYRKLVDFILEEKQLRHALEHNVGTLQQQLARNKATHQALEVNYQTLIQGLSNISATHADLKSKGAGLETQNRTIYTVLAKDRTDITNLQQKTSPVSAFTAWYPTTSSRSSSYMGFSSILTNIGNDFNKTSGVFTCRYPGIYSFYLHLYRYPTTSSYQAYCYIYKNSKSYTYAYSYPYSGYRGGYHESTNTITFRLRRGDTVSVGGCNTISSTVQSYTSFSGFLVKAD